MATPQWSYEEVPTPVLENDFQSLAQQAINQRIAWFNEKDWRTIHNANGVQIEEKRFPGSSIDAVRATTILENVNIDDVLRCYFNAELDEKKKADPDIKYHRNVQVIDAQTLVTHSQYNTPFGVTNREFVALRSWSRIPNGYIIVIHSINTPTIPFSDGHVRGLSNCGTILEQLEGNRVRIRTVDHIEPKGWILSSIINMYKLKTITKLQRIQDAYRLK